MSLHSQKEFLSAHHPFDKLSKSELDLCLKNINIGYYPIDTIIISPTHIANHFFIIIKGEVNESVIPLFWSLLSNTKTLSEVKFGTLHK